MAAALLAFIMNMAIDAMITAERLVGQESELPFGTEIMNLGAVFRNHVAQLVKLGNLFCRV